MTQVLIVEDQKMVLDSMTSYITSNKNYAFAGGIANAALAETFCMAHHVDLILMDVCTEHEESGLEAAAVIKKHFPDIKIIIVTSMVECSFINRAKSAGADSFWYKDGSPESFLDIINRTMQGEHIFPERTPEVKLGLTTSYHLTDTELLVLRLLMESANYQEVADKMGCSERNVRFHLNNMLDKTGYRNRFELCLAAAQKKLIITNPDKAMN